MKLLTLLLAATLAACSGSSTETKPTPEAGKTNPEGKAKKAKAAKPGAPQAPAAGAEGEEKEDQASAPILRTGRFRVPLKDLPTADVEAVRAAILAAWTKTAKEADAPAPAEEAAKPWKCRHATVWEVATPTPNGPQLRMFERLNDPDCKKADAKEERWELSLRYNGAARPTSRTEGGKFRYLMASQDLDWAGAAYTESFSTIYRLDGGEADGGFPHDEAWLKENLPTTMTLGAKKAELDGYRWAIATVNIAGEKVTIEAERWNCLGADKTVGAELVFRTNKRGAGHTTTSPKDVVITDKIKAFADAVAKELGDKVGGAGTSSEAALTCATGS